MNAHSDDDGSDKYTNVNLGVKSFWGSLGQMEINFLYGKKDLQMQYGVCSMVFLTIIPIQMPTHTALRRNIFWTKKFSDFKIK
ncbi:MAG: hypothetical protein MZV70_36810 [Desulfobacterales bacterium]|nr:hypothetical protein [Desulfobacterales bacterium]